MAEKFLKTLEQPYNIPLQSTVVILFGNEKKTLDMLYKRPSLWPEKSVYDCMEDASHLVLMRRFKE